MEMSVGTIVTIVLLMSVLVLGIVLTKSIFESSKGAIDMTDQQLQSEISKLFGEEDSKLVIYPTSKKLILKKDDNDAIGLGIKNIADNVNAPTSFSYEILYRDNDCGLTQKQVEDWIRIGGTEENIPIAIGDFSSPKIEFRASEGTPKCLASFRVNVKRGGEVYVSDTFTIEHK